MPPGRAPRSQRGGQGFESLQVHQKNPSRSTKTKKSLLRLFCFAAHTSREGFEAALRKQSGGLFSAVTEEFCEALRMKSAFMLRKIQEESLQVHQNKKVAFAAFLFCHSYIAGGTRSSVRHVKTTECRFVSFRRRRPCPAR